MMKKNALMLLSDGQTIPRITGYNVEAVGGYSGLPLRNYNIPRISGSSRYDTSAVLAKKAFKDSDKAILVSGRDFPDALAAVSLSIKLDAPILLTSNNSLSPSVQSYIQSTIISVNIVGGRYSVSTSISYTISSMSAGGSEPQPVPQPEPQPIPQAEPQPIPQPIPQPEPQPAPTPMPQPTPNPGNQYPGMSDCEYDDNGKFAFDKNTQTITGYIGYKKRLILPSSIDGVQVKNIGIRWSNISPEAVVVPEGVETINDGCFRGCSLEKVHLPSSLKIIGYNAFFNNKLTSIVIPPRVDIIGNSAFSYNRLTNINIPPSVTKIYDAAFKHNYIRSVHFNEGLKDIGSYVFGHNEISGDVKIPRTVRDFYSDIFDDNPSIGKVYYPDTASDHQGSYYRKDYYIAY